MTDERELMQARRVAEHMARLRQQGMHNAFTVNGAELNVSQLDFPTVEHYGFDHGQQMQLLTPRIAMFLEIENKQTLDALKLAGLMHDLGRKTPHREPDPEHRFRSADAAVRWMNLQSMSSSLIEETAWLIANHDLSAKEAPTDRRLQAMWDADSLESARFSPGTGEGLRLFNARAAKFCTAFARNRDVQKTWMKTRGWKL